MVSVWEHRASVLEGHIGDGSGAHGSILDRSCIYTVFKGLSNGIDDGVHGVPKVCHSEWYLDLF